MPSVCHVHVPPLEKLGVHPRARVNQACMSRFLLAKGNALGSCPQFCSWIRTQIHAIAFHYILSL